MEQLGLGFPSEWPSQGWNDPGVSSEKQSDTSGSGFDQKKRRGSSSATTEVEEDGNSSSFFLTLGASSYPCVDDPAAKNSRRCWSSSPSGQQYPKCQVDDCSQDLTHAKEYHRRHKVCQLHSKASQALVHQVLQRFCQQCSRFHSLTFFDEGKRSCRRRLAGHNKRRRKNLSQAATLGASLVSEAIKGADLLNVVNLLSQIQSSALIENANRVPTSQESLLNIIKKASVSTPVEVDEATRGDTGRNGQFSVHSSLVGQSVEKATMVDRECEIGISKALPENRSLPLTNNLLRSSTMTGIPDLNSQSEASPAMNLIELVGSPSANISQPLHTNLGISAVGRTSFSRKGDQRMSNSRSENKVKDSYIEMQCAGRIELTTNEISDSGSDDTLTISSWQQERACRIVFKFMDTDPRSLTQDECAQIYSWIAAIPAVVERYFRPGCVILTLFLSMQWQTWQQLCNELDVRLERFLRSSTNGLWSRGRILLQVGHRQLVIVDGAIKMATNLNPEACPRLTCVRPLAVVAGKETPLIVQGQNLASGTKIICSYLGKYMLQELSECADEVKQERQRVNSICFNGGPSSDAIGRCFVEVADEELSGDFWPVIVADSVAICEELRSLEQEVDASCWPPGSKFVKEDDPLVVSGLTFLQRKAQALSFLHELGWVFQKSIALTHPRIPGPSRFPPLLFYAVNRDWCAVVKKLLDILFDCYVEEEEGGTKVVEILSESSLLHQAVKRKCRRMAELLLLYAPGQQCVFSPSTAGAGGLTPLHIAASMADAEEMVDVLTNDPYKVGLNAWKNARDALGLTPEWYALESGNASYVQLVERKVARNQGGDVQIWIPESERGGIPITTAGMKAGASYSLMLYLAKLFKSPASSCKECNHVLALQGRSKISGIKGSMYRPLVLSMVAIATLCVCVMIFLKSLPHLGFNHPLKWEDIDFGAI